MKPKNSKERRNSFLKFLGLFLVTVAMVVTAVYFNFKVPKKENALLRAESELIAKDKEFQSNFYEEMKSVNSMIDSLDTPGANVVFESSKINEKLVAMMASIPAKDSTYVSDMHESIINLYLDMMKTNEKLRSFTDSEETIQEYEDMIKEYQRDIKNLERELRLK